MDSQPARRLYFEAYDFTDYAWPGPGGHVVRTIRDPWGTAAHVVMLGGSDAAGVGEAAEALATLVQQRGSALGYVNQVKLGRWASLIEAYRRQLAAERQRCHLDAKRVGRRVLGLPDPDRQGGYRLFADRQRSLPDAVSPRTALLVRPYRARHLSPHGRRQSQAARVHQHHPYSLGPGGATIRRFPAAERHKIDADFLWVLSSTEGPGRIERESRKRQIRSNHGTRAGMDAFFGGRYFTRRYDLEEAEHWLEIADRYFSAANGLLQAVRGLLGPSMGGLDVRRADLLPRGRQVRVSPLPGFKLAADRALIAHPAGIRAAGLHVGLRGRVGRYGLPERLGR